MPELPEVETTVSYLQKNIIGLTIQNVWFDYQKTIKNLEKEEITKILKNKTVQNIERRGKNILIYLTDNYLLLIHQKLTGHLLYGQWKYQNNKWIPLENIQSLSEPVNKFIHFLIEFDNHKMLALSDMRRFAKVVIGKTEKVLALKELKELGPDPLDPSTDWQTFKNLILSQKRKIKQVLMDQTVISGIGNIYSDEILWASQIHPAKPANKLTEPEIKNIYRNARNILQMAIKEKGTSFSDYRVPNGQKGNFGQFLKVYGRQNQKCPRCQHLIQTLKIGSRTAHYCPNCQKL